MASNSEQLCPARAADLPLLHRWRMQNAAKNRQVRAPGSG
jgi:hypothetical protein